MLRGNLHQGAPPQTLIGRKWWLWGLDQEMSRHSIDVFHGTDFSVPYLRRRPSVMTLHDLSPWLDETWQPGASRVRRRTPALLRSGRATFVITPSEAVRRAATERFALNPDRVVAIPLAAAEHFRPVETPPPPKPYFLFVGTLEPRKNIGRLIEAWREIHQRHDVDLVLAGRTRADFTAPSPEPGLRLLGAVPEEDLAALYSGALACVYPSLYEGFGLPVLEAMQCGTLTVTSNDPAIREVSGGAAIHVEASETQSFVNVLAAIAHSPETFSEQRVRGLARAREFTWQRTARLTREVYEQARRVFHA
jgi:alpha-1,3-rhamnosyl/mannosyltransferase